MNSIKINGRSLLPYLVLGIAFAWMPISSTYAATKAATDAGCCSGHGGVVGCDAKTGRHTCKDGTVSPSCKCAAATDNKKAAGCCSGHGGVVGCDKKSGRSLCKDGTVSPTCKCE